MKRIQEFIDNNPNAIDIDYLKREHSIVSEVDSTINGMLVILAGYCCYIEETDATDVADYLDKDEEWLIDNIFDEFERVLDFASANNYGEWWKITDAKTQYKF